MNELPRATASGPGAETPEAVSALRVGIGAGVLAALYLLLMYIVTPVPLRLVAMFGGADSELDRDGGVELEWQPPAGADAMAIVRDFAHRSRATAKLRADGRGTIVITVPGVAREDADEVARRMGGEGRLAFREVIQAEEMKQLAELLGLPMASARPVDLEVDQWQTDTGRGVETDYYLAGTRAAIEAALASAREQMWRLPAGTRIAYERIGDDWRTYVVRDEAEIDGDDIASAQTSYDPHTNRPIVLLDFEVAAAERFGAITTRLVGKKLAIMIGEEVRSAPVINNAIHGGRASITMGAGDPAKQEQEAHLLVTTLRAGALPRGGTVRAVRYVAPIDDAPMVWLARAAIALGGGGLIALLVWVVIRVTRPVRRRAPPRVDGSLPWSRIVVTLFAVAGVAALPRIGVLGIDEEELVFRAGPDALAHFHAGALGLGPVILAFVLVEVAALVVPGWRRRRHAGVVARRPLTLAAAVLALALVAVQGWFVTVYLSSIGDALPFGMWPRVLVIGSLAAGTLAYVALAELVRWHGVGNGYGVVIGSAWLVTVAEVARKGVQHGSLPPAGVVVGAATMAGIAIPFLIVLRWRIARVGEAPLRLPTSGIAPLGDAAGLVMLAGTLALFHLDEVVVRLTDWSYAIREHRSLVAALLIASALVWSFAFARPPGLARLAQRAGLAPPSWRAWGSATLLTVASLLLVGAAVLVTSQLRVEAAWLADAVTVGLVAAVALDALDDLRARRVALEHVWSVQQAQHADLAARVLGDANIPCHLASSHVRTLLAFFGPYAPIDVLVAPEHAPAARTRLAELFEQ